MTQKPLSVARYDYVNAVCNLTNDCELPAFVIVYELENILRELRPIAENEYKRDKAAYEAALKQADTAEQE